MKKDLIEAGLALLNFLLVYEGAKSLLIRGISYFASLRTIAKADVSEILTNFENRLYEVEKDIRTHIGV